MSTLIKQDGEWVKVAGNPVWGVLRPDWSNAVSVTLTEVIAGYTIPADGIFIFSIDVCTPTDTYAKMTINNVEVSRGFRWSSVGSASYLIGQVPVSKGDIAKTVDLSTSINNQDKIHFVPWKTEPLSSTDKQYISDQNELSDYESITLSTTTTVMPYDGILEVTWSIAGVDGYDRAVYISGAAAAKAIGSNPTTGAKTIVLNAVFRKNDPITISNNDGTTRVRYYKKRDYSMR